MWWLLLACATPGDFEPAKGPGEPPAQARGLERDSTGPWAVGLELAFSDDGLNFQRSGSRLVDQAGVPALVAMSDGTLLIYYTAWQDGENFTAVMFRRPDGSARYRRVVVEGAEGEQPNYPDPSVVALPDGRLRMAYLSESGGKRMVRSAVSQDGVNFTAEPGVRWAPETGREPLRDPLLLRLGDSWLLLVGPPGTAAGWSEDGLNFRPVAAPTLDGKPFMPVGGARLPDGSVRLYGYRDGALGQIVAIRSKDLKRWRQEPGTPHPDGARCKGNGELAVARMQDGRWAMVLSTPLR